MTQGPIQPAANELRIPEEGRTEGFNAWDPAITRQIDALVSQAGSPGEEDNSDLVREIIVTALKAQHARLQRGDVKILSRALRELRYGFRIFQPYRHLRKVTIFGSARSRPKDVEYRQARAFARKMIQRGYMIITGAGPGIMQAGNEGAGPEKSFGINIRLPYEQSANAWVARGERYIDCRFFFTRKLMFIKEANAVALFPGGFGTHDEGMEVLTLVQTGKADPMPIVFIDTPGGEYWKDWERYVRRHLLRRGKIAEEDLALFKITDSVNDAAREIDGFYKNYHSLRYVKGHMVIRLNRPIPGAELEALNRQYRDILLRGSRFELGKALPEEGEHPELPRLIFAFNRFNFGRLRGLIDILNRH